MGEIEFLKLQSSKTYFILETLQNKVKTCKNHERFEGRNSRSVRDGRELTLAENGEKSSPVSAKGPFYRWLARPHSGAERASACMPCSAAEHEVRRPNLDFPHLCFRGPKALPKCMHVRRPNLRFDGRTWVFLQDYFHAKTHFLSCLKT